MIFTTGSITVVNANLASGVPTAGSTIGVKDDPTNTAQASIVYGNMLAMRTITFNVTGTWTGTLVLQESLDGVNWYNNGNLTPKAGGAVVASLTANGAYTATITCAVQLRITASAVMTGAAVVAIRVCGDY